LPRLLVLIADDEPAARRGVRQLLARYENFVVAGECRNGAEVLAALDTIAADVIFLDIQMPGINAFEVIRRRGPARMPIVVFLTAYDEYAIRAFEVQALDYLVKPVSDARFAATIERISRQLEISPSQPPGFVITTSTGVTVLPVRRVDWIESAGTYARLWIGRRSYLIRQSLRDLEERLRAYGFARAHRRALVCLDRVRTLGARSAVLESGTEIEISRRQRAAFVAALRAQSVSATRPAAHSAASRSRPISRRPRRPPTADETSALHIAEAGIERDLADRLRRVFARQGRRVSPVHRR